MSTPTGTGLTPELVDRVMQLSPEDKDRLADMLLEDKESTVEDSEAMKLAWQAELARRLDDIKSGKAKTYSVEESMAYLRQAFAEAIAK